MGCTRAARAQRGGLGNRSMIASPMEFRAMLGGS
jgi:hypothetical protein